ncbi:MAG: ankyrin repeat domain-containing protein [Sodalis sp. (in: enterobacteria)]|uniref:ankyrin repeat domain-containing protein n=1 Tax=Sodalis sp. (in: enterobacteria) TaxID=1898979 RepID=UPI003F322C77
MTVQILLGQAGIEINRADQLGFTPLMRAAQGNHPLVIAELLTHPGTALNLRNISGMSALSLAVERGHRGGATAVVGAGSQHPLEGQRRPHSLDNGAARAISAYRAVA